MANFFEVGGAVRDELLGIPLDKIKDVDFAVEAESFEAMKQELLDREVEIFLEKPEYFTIRGRIPPRSKQWRCPGKAVDFVLCRKDGTYSDGRRPDEVRPGSIFDDLERRDFTVNAIARCSDGSILDPFEGVVDLQRKRLRCVGTTRERFTEDALRALRAIRFIITKDFHAVSELSIGLISEWLPPLMMNISHDRKKDELEKCFRHDTILTLDVLYSLPLALRQSIFRNYWNPKGVWLMPTLVKQ